jgi:hypothetical protein
MGENRTTECRRLVCDAIASTLRVRERDGGGGKGWAMLSAAWRGRRPRNPLAAWRAIDIVPALAGAHVIRTWSGMDGQMPDHIPDMGFSSVR